MNKNVERGRATRAHVIEVATRLFAEHGYDDTSIEAVQAGSAVSRGSLYHHFPGKEALFWRSLRMSAPASPSRGRRSPGTHRTRSPRCGRPAWPGSGRRATRSSGRSY